MSLDKEPGMPPPGSTRLPLAAVTESRPARAGRPGRVNALVIAYLLAALLVAAAGDRLPAPRWLALHVLFLGAATNAVVIWSAHFAGALLHARADSRRGEPSRLVLLNGGVLLVLAGVGWQLSSPVVLVGAGLVVAAGLAHLVALLRLRRGSLGGALAPATWFFVASAASLVVGAALGGILGGGLWPAGHERLHLAHAHVNLLGWLGLAVLGSLFMLWPAVLRTRMAENAPHVARQVLVLTVSGLLLATCGLLADLRLVAAVGLTAYGAGVARSLGPFLTVARRRPPRTAAAWMLAAATAWLVVAVTVDLLVLALGGQGAALALFDHGLPVFGLGFVAQVLGGALTFLLPVVLGRGPDGNRELSALLESAWPARVAALNAGVLLLGLRFGRDADLVAWTLVFGAGGSFVLLAAAAFLPSGRRRWVWAAVLLLVPSLVVASSRGTVPVPGKVASAAVGSRTVSVALQDFSVTPTRLTVAAGTRLLLDVRNEGHLPHDLRVGGHRGTRLLSAHERQTIDVGVVTRSLQAWCTVAAHHQAGMVLDIEVTGTRKTERGADPSAMWNPMGVPAPDWRPYDARLRPAAGGSEHHLTLRVQERLLELAPGVVRPMWTFGGTVPGPVLRGRVGDLFTVQLVNDGSMSHSLDLHASEVAPDVTMRSIPPGTSSVYQFRAERAGMWMYHCGTAPLLQHVGNGMYGAVVIDPPHLRHVDREFVLVQSELYLDGTLAAMRAAHPDAVVFNGYADQYLHAPLHAQPGDRIRIWVLDAGPNNSSAFHVVGAQFDTVYKEGSYLLRPGSGGGSQALDLASSQGGFVELTIPQAGSYAFLTHRLADAASGATGLLIVQPSWSNPPTAARPRRTGPGALDGHRTGSP